MKILMLFAITLYYFTTTHYARASDMGKSPAKGNPNIIMDVKHIDSTRLAQLLAKYTANYKNIFAEGKSKDEKKREKFAMFWNEVQVPLLGLLLKKNGYPSHVHIHLFTPVNYKDEDFDYFMKVRKQLYDTVIMKVDVIPNEKMSEHQCRQFEEYTKWLSHVFQMDSELGFSKDREKRNEYLVLWNIQWTYELDEMIKLAGLSSVINLDKAWPLLKNEYTDEELKGLIQKRMRIFLEIGKVFRGASDAKGVMSNISGSNSECANAGDTDDIGRFIQTLERDPNMNLRTTKMGDWLSNLSLEATSSDNKNKRRDAAMVNKKEKLVAANQDKLEKKEYRKKVDISGDLSLEDKKGKQVDSHQNRLGSILKQKQPQIEILGGTTLGGDQKGKQVVSNQEKLKKIRKQKQQPIKVDDSGKASLEVKKGKQVASNPEGYKNIKKEGQSKKKIPVTGSTSSTESKRTPVFIKRDEDEKIIRQEQHDHGKLKCKTEPQPMTTNEPTNGKNTTQGKNGGRGKKVHKSNEKSKSSDSSGSSNSTKLWVRKVPLSEIMLKHEKKPDQQ